jgi:5-methyltetrahydropteroyltriglutamate--homocysteine methyltransferase
VTERIEGVGKPQVEVPPANFMADKGPGDLMWEVIETRMTPPVTGKIGATDLQLDRAYKAIAPMTDRPVKIGSISAQILALMLNNQHYKDRLELLMDLSAALNKEYHALADAGAPIVQVEEPAIHQMVNDPNQKIKPEQWVEAFNREVQGLRDKCEVWCHTCWGSPAAQRVASKDQSYRSALPYFDQLDVDVITVEGAFNRGMDLEHFGKIIGKDKKIALGVISHRTLQVERPEEIAELIRRAIKYIEPERLILTSDCGFGRQSMSRMHAFYKMVALTRGTNIMRKELGLPEANIPATDPQLSMVPTPRRAFDPSTAPTGGFHDNRP